MSADTRTETADTTQTPDPHAAPAPSEAAAAPAATAEAVAGSADLDQPLSDEESRDRHRAAELEEYQSDGFVPRGTLLFLLVMLTGYALYWAYLWFIVVIERS